MLRQLSLFAWALCARSVCSLDCEELTARCREYGKQERLTVERFMSLSIPWPVTAEILREYQPVDEAFCRYSNQSGYCYRDLLTSCPEFLQDHPKGWYAAENYIAMGRLCATSIAPVKHFRAVSHCRRHDPKLQQSFRRAAKTAAKDRVDDVPINSHPGCGRVEYCYFNAAAITESSGPAGAARAAHCGEEAVETIRESARQIYAAHCLNDSERHNIRTGVQR
ncbi:uncharacterized protein LOC129581662 [Paramacrobiotus metropolitanus]|uniref:uncharacterized protein LOC129581662 n=1 Tax=Paramacrobiotus metropolitanus TaxID=2943436 RepID=UPI002445B07C|nr:uncharacterized protein LOC129581662 [Paramacrobiotus metropolitanus]